ncbi:hypothetical protein ACJMK2_011179 [Sinanodonta woodiana]|uniref:Uncharacterized protein n=1 Tax=Sinanodonta woodiana TaxID=1069815 RepID=A0ABD3V448_SINWO
MASNHLDENNKLQEVVDNIGMLDEILMRLKVMVILDTVIKQVNTLRKATEMSREMIMSEKEKMQDENN